MAQDKTITQENFKHLLNWLDDDTEVAAEKYEIIHQRLIRIFAGRGCPDAEILADLTIDRVTMKIDKLCGNYVGAPAAYFHGVAKKIYFEWLRRQKKVNEAAALYSLDNNPSCDDDDDDAEYCSLEVCLDELQAGDREFILEYYFGEKRAKIQSRKRLAERLGISIGALHIRASRIRSRLHECVLRCADKN